MPCLYTLTVKAEVGGLLLLQHTFALTSEVRKKNSSKVAVERLDLAFESLEDAERWREHIEDQVWPLGKLRNRESPQSALCEGRVENFRAVRETCRVSPPVEMQFWRIWSTTEGDAFPRVSDSQDRVESALRVSGNQRTKEWCLAADCSHLSARQAV